MKPKVLRQSAKPIGLAFRGDRLYILLANSRLYTTPLALYHWLEQAPAADRHTLDFRPTNIWWPTLENAIYIEELLLAETTCLVQEDWLTYVKRQVIIALDTAEATLFQHRLPGLCRVVSFSSWWGEQWLSLP